MKIAIENNISEEWHDNVTDVEGSYSELDPDYHQSDDESD